jgi:hypothetical protein
VNVRVAAVLSLEQPAGSLRSFFFLLTKVGAAVVQGGTANLSALHIGCLL